MLIEAGVLALVLASCGGAGQSPSPPRLKEPDQGDERGIRVVVGVRVTRGAVRVEPHAVDAFLPLRFTATNETRRRITLRIGGLEMLQLGPGLTASRDADGGPPRKVVLRAGSGRRAVVRVR